MTTKVIYQLNQRGNFQSISIKNHAGYQEKGQDIVCAGISAITNGTINFLRTHYQNDCQIFSRPAEIVISPTRNNPDCQLCLRLTLYQLKNVADAYPPYLKISQEV